MSTVVFVMGCGAAASAQQAQDLRAMGTVATQDALITGGLEVQGSQARLISNVGITAHDRTAAIALERGGEVLVCATSEFHLLHSGTGESLLFGLDRGAVELHGKSEAQDVILTPDIRFTVEAKGSYDLRLRVTRSGDTCVENAGKASPVLMLNEAFSQASYRVMPGQHVLFEHGDLHEVVDNERSSCGCPHESVPMQISEGASPADKANAAHPFPTAVSEGLEAQPADTKPRVVGQTQTELTLSNTEGQVAPVKEDASPAIVPAVAAAAPPPAPPGAHAIFHSIGHFFHKLFRGQE